MNRFTRWLAEWLAGHDSKKYMCEDPYVCCIHRHEVGR